MRLRKVVYWVMGYGHSMGYGLFDRLILRFEK